MWFLDRCSFIAICSHLLVCANVVSYLNGKYNECHKDHDDHQELRGPDLGSDVSKAHRGEGDHAEVKRVEQREVVACSFEVLDPADAGGEGES